MFCPYNSIVLSGTVASIQLNVQHNYFTAEFTVMNSANRPSIRIDDWNGARLFV